MREIYEVDMPPPARTAADIHPGHAAFWKHRTRVTVEHIIRQFQDDKSNMTTCKVLGKFLAEVQCSICNLIDREHIDWKTLINGECKWLSGAYLFVFRYSLFSLSQEHNLRAVRYLPDILALLRILTDRFHRRIDREKANQLKIRELLQEFSKKGSTVHPYLSKVFASGLYSETWCQNIVMKSFSPSCMFSLQPRDQF